MEDLMANVERKGKDVERGSYWPSGVFQIPYLKTNGIATAMGIVF